MLTRRRFLHTTGTAGLAALATFRDDNASRLEAASRMAEGIPASDLADDES